MLRLFVEDGLAENQTIRTSKEHKHYLEKVMRTTDKNVMLFNGKDGEFLAKYEAGQFQITEQKRAFEFLPKKALAFGLIKNHRLSWLIEKSCELDVTDLFPLITERVQFSTFKVDRAKRILIEAAEQCGRITVPVLHAAQHLDEFSNTLPCDYFWNFGSLSTDESLKHRNNPSGYIIGPEGGLTDKEELTLSSAGAFPFSMGDLTLRAETAGLWCLSQPVLLVSVA